MSEKLDGHYANNITANEAAPYEKATETGTVIEFASLQPQRESTDATKKELAVYYKEIRRHLTCPRKEKRRFLKEIRRMVEDLFDTHPSAEFSDVLECLGQPEDLARSLLLTLGPSVLSTYRKYKKRIKITLISCMTALIIGLISFSYYIYQLKSEAVFMKEQTIYIYEERAAPSESLPFPKTPLRDRIGRDAAYMPLANLSRYSHK